MTVHARRALVLVGCFALVVACSAAQSKAEITAAAIAASCAETLAEARAGGEAGSLDEIKTGCEAELRVWSRAP